MKQYRILQVSENVFRPQYKGLFFWSGWGKYSEYPQHGTDMRRLVPVQFDTVIEAMNFVNEIIKVKEIDKGFPKVIELMVTDRGKVAAMFKRKTANRGEK